MNDLIIIGGGPAAAAAAVYAARKQLQTVVIAEEFGGQSAVSTEIYNWIGTRALSGTDLALSLKSHVTEYIGNGKTVTLHEGTRVTAVTKTESGFSAALSDGKSIEAKSVLIASGSRRRKLEIPGALEFDNKGVMYCATCDAPLFGGVPVAIIGGGNAAFEGALQVAQYATKVYILHRNDNFKADEITLNEVKKLPNVKILTNVELKEITGSKFVEAIHYSIKGSEEIVTLPVGGIFVEIGQLPNTELAKGLVAIDEHDKVIVDPRTQRTSQIGVWAAGDCTDGLYHQNNIAAGDAVKAVENLYIWLKTGK